MFSRSWAEWGLSCLLPLRGFGLTPVEWSGWTSRGARQLYYAAQQLRDDGYVRAEFAGGMTLVNLKLTREGREAARTVFDPMEKMLAENRAKLGSDSFKTAFPNAYELWADAVRLLYGDTAAAELTTIGHKAREAAQAFATAAIDTFGADDPPGDTKLVKKR